MRGGSALHSGPGSDETAADLLDSLMQRMALGGLGGIALLAALAFILWPAPGADRPVPVALAPPVAVPAQPVVPAPVAPAEPAAAAAAPAATPQFDVVRVGARGAAVVAGRAAPGAEVMLMLDGRRELGRARADGRGEWVILPPDSLPPGAWDLSLRARQAGQEVAGADTVVVVVPEAAPAQPAATAPRTAEPAPGPIAVLIPPAAEAAAPRILQGPQPAAPGAVPPAAPAARSATPPRLGLDSVDYEEGGGIRFAGTATPGASVRVYVGERHAGDAVADAAGRWMLAPEEQPPVGRNALRVDQLAASGGVAARIEVPFQRDVIPPEAFDNRAVVVQPGENLWRIARGTYGRGVRYTVIYQANRDQIRDPNRIFPGQIFALPEGAETPSASSVSR